jgi:hypothetical protein
VQGRNPTRQFAKSLRMFGDEHYLRWADLLHSVRSGESAFQHRYGMGLFAWYQQQPQRSAIFDGAMGDHSRAESAGLQLQRIVPTAAPVSVVAAVATSG